VGLRLRGRLPALGGGPHVEDIPPAFMDLASLLLEVFSLPEVSVTSLANVTSNYVYTQFTSTLPPPKVESRQPDLPWRIAWARLAGPALSAAAADVISRYCTTSSPSRSVAIVSGWPRRRTAPTSLGWWRMRCISSPPVPAPRRRGLFWRSASPS
jgi:hypothetical protein